MEHFDVAQCDSKTTVSLRASIARKLEDSQLELRVPAITLYGVLRSERRPEPQYDSQLGKTMWQ
jgi:hypothetical protein